ncbi:M3 family oligoendopeptidase [Rhodovibrionaceae bacterium A322]
MVETAADQALGTLPEWDLTDLFPSSDGPELQEALARLTEEATAFRKDFEGRVADLSGAELGGAIARCEALEESLGRVTSYAQLVYSGNISDPENARFFQSMQEKATALSSELLFFTLEINKLDDDQLTALMSDASLAAYEPWLRDLRSFRPHQLPDEHEKLLHEKQITGRSAWNRLFDETMAGLTFELDGEQLSNAEILNRMSNPDGGVRERAAKSFGKVLNDNIRLFGLVTNTLAKDKQMEDDWRGFKAPVSSRNLANAVEDEVVDALVQSVVQSYPQLSHRYYQLKASWMGKDKLPYWDRNAPLPEADDRLISWPEAQDTVLTAYRSFSPALADVGQKFFDKAWIDAPARAGKAPGAFAHPTVPSAHPYLLLNYQGKVRDVMTLAHELGHGVHQVLAADQGYFLSQTPLTLAETASVFGEMLTFQSMLKKTTDPVARKVMLAGKVEDMLNTVVRQIAFHRFETEVHDARKQGELLPQDLGDIWMKTQTEALGPVFTFDEEYKSYWAYIPHFIHVPFYVYAYAFGDCLVNSLYAVYQDAEDGFAEKYLEMLGQGGVKRHKELLAPFGLDASDPAFWQKGLQVISSLIDELEALEA